MEDQGRMLNPNYRLTIIAVSAVAVILFCCRGFIFENTASPGPGSAAESVRDQDMASGEKVKVFSMSGFSDSGKKSWQLNGKSADIFADVIKLFDINGNSYGDGVKVSLVSDNGIFDRKTNNIELRNNVSIATDEGTTLKTEVLKWDSKEKIVFTDDKVYINRKEMDMSGTGALARHSLKLVQLDRDITVDLKDPAAVITCAGPLEVDYAKNAAIFNNDVRVTDKEVFIGADKATAYFEPKSRSLKMIFCQGNVNIKRGQDSTLAKQLTYLPGEGRVLLEGRPRIIIRSGGDFIQRFRQKKESAGEQIKG
ncbi:MAG: LPS export ABC transporter periplasmic protein LptC [Candidatus Omnitrophica bacterium]|nr:LPS export ABC transporter periplasmic protein LptC [Candidatus Omnitrophota bacterium]